MKTRSNLVRPRLAAALLVTGFIALAGCGKKDADTAAPKAGPAPAATTAAPPPAAASDREIKITSIHPDNISLTAGQTIKINVSAAYTLPPQGGSVGIVVQDAKNALVANKLKPVGGGSGTFTDEIEFKVPATDRVAVHVPLYVKDETKSATVSSKEYTVRPK